MFGTKGQQNGRDAVTEHVVNGLAMSFGLKKHLKYALEVYITNAEIRVNGYTVMLTQLGFKRCSR